jgi:hypothetical protein
MEWTVGGASIRSLPDLASILASQTVATGAGDVESTACRSDHRGIVAVMG